MMKTQTSILTQDEVEDDVMEMENDGWAVRRPAA